LQKLVKKLNVNLNNKLELIFIIVHYSLRIDGGEEISNSIEYEAPTMALLGSGEILPSLEKALLTMKVGENSTFSIPGNSLI